MKAIQLALGFENPRDRGPNSADFANIVSQAFVDGFGHRPPYMFGYGFGNFPDGFEGLGRREFLDSGEQLAASLMEARLFRSQFSKYYPTIRGYTFCSLQEQSARDLRVGI